MIHLIIIFHFFCFSFGMGFITFCGFLYRKNHSHNKRDLLIFETGLAVLFLVDTLSIYIRKLLIQYHIEKVFVVFNYVLVLFLLFYGVKVIHRIRIQEIYKRCTHIGKVILVAMVFECMIYIVSFWVDILGIIPNLCLIYLLQCIFVIQNHVVNEKEDKISNNFSLERAGLTKREQEIVSYICIGFSNKEIGDKLYISPNTVKNHIYSIYKKLNVKNKVELTNLVNSRG